MIKELESTINSYIEYIVSNFSFKLSNTKALAKSFFSVLYVNFYASNHSILFLFQIVIPGSVWKVQTG